MSLSIPTFQYLSGQLEHQVHQFESASQLEVTSATKIAMHMKMDFENTNLRTSIIQK